MAKKTAPRVELRGRAILLSGGVRLRDASRYNSDLGVAGVESEGDTAVVKFATRTKAKKFYDDALWKSLHLDGADDAEWWGGDMARQMSRAMREAK